MVVLFDVFRYINLDYAHRALSIEIGMRTRQACVPGIFVSCGG